MFATCLKIFRTISPFDKTCLISIPNEFINLPDLMANFFTNILQSAFFRDIGRQFLIIFPKVTLLLCVVFQSVPFSGKSRDDLAGNYDVVKTLINNSASISF